jgi:diguanylate cyclase (GGDEF)-like protein
MKEPRRMNAVKGPLARIDHAREQLAKAWLVRLIERASLDEIKDLPTERIARELPELISDIVGLVAAGGDEPVELSEEQAQRAASLAALRQGGDSSAADLARDMASLQAVLVRALSDELAESDPAAFALVVERLADAAGAVQAAAIDHHVRTRSRDLETQANTDPLTGLYNLRYVQRHIVHLLDVHKRYEQPFAVLLMDIDGLKRINDAHGHAAGDRVLMQVAMSTRRAIRTVDTAARLGGDEFCVLAPNQDAKGGVALAGRLAAAVEDEMSAGEIPPVGLSIGVVACPTHGDDAEVLIERADRAMYRAKAAGESVAMGDADDAAVAEEAKPSR